MSNSFVTLWTTARQSRLSVGFPRQECWSGLPFPSPEDLPDPGIEPTYPPLQVILYPWATGEAQKEIYLREIKVCVHKNIWTWMFIICHSPNLETVQMPFSSQMDTQIVVHLYNEKLLCTHKNIMTIKISLLGERNHVKKSTYLLQEILYLTTLWLEKEARQER